MMRAKIDKISEDAHDAKHVVAYITLEDGATYDDLKKLIEPSSCYAHSYGVIGIDCQPAQPVAGYALQRVQEILQVMEDCLEINNTMPVPLGVVRSLLRQRDMVETLLKELRV